MRFRRICGVALLFVFSLSAVAAVSKRPTQVEVVSPKPPTPVTADGKRVLVYELHVTNFGSKPLVFERVEVYPLNVTTALQNLSGDALKKCLWPVGMSDPTRLEPGSRVIVFLWVALAAETAVPESLRHRLSFKIDDPTQPMDSVIDGLMVPVSHDPVPVLSSPFGEGEWYGGNGPSNFSAHRRSVMSLEGGVFIAQRFATDWMLIGKNGDTKHGGGKTNEDYWGYGQPIHAVADGVVTEAVDRYPDNQPKEGLKEVTVENIAGNHVILQIGPKQYVMFAHLKAGSVRVHVGDKVQRGDVVAELGDSGNTTGPHMHMEVMDRSSPMASEGIPFVFDQFRFLGWGKDFEENKHPDEPRKNEMPVDDTVVRFQ